MNILIASKIHPHFIEKMLQAGHKCVENIMKDSSELEQEISKYEGIVINSRFVIGKELIDKAIQLKFLARIGAGMESIDTEYLEKKVFAGSTLPKATVRRWANTHWECY